MIGLKYQLKNIRRDKLCILTFLLPIIAGIAISLLSGVSFSVVSENSFGVIENELETSALEWLESIGNVTVFQSRETLEEAVEEPSSQMIGVLQNDDKIKTMLSGDELSMYVTVARTLPQLFSERNLPQAYRQTLVPNTQNDDGLKPLLTAITLVTAMFMGCTFNAMSMIGEKEDGVALINEILPMTAQNYIVQKIFLGFVGAVLSAIATALLCMRIGTAQIISLVILIIFSSLISAMIGLFIGRLSAGMMVGIVYIKTVMIAFLAPPILIYLMVPADSAVYALSYLLPSSATFYGLMRLMNGSTGIWTELIILAAHCIAWFVLYQAISKRSKKYA